MNVMAIAWEIAYEGQEKFGGKIREYFSQALKIAWSIIKGEEKEMTIKPVENFKLGELEGTEKQVEWAKEIRQKAVNKMFYDEVMYEEYVQKSMLPMGKDTIQKTKVEPVVKAIFSQEGIENYINEARNEEVAIKAIEKAIARFERFKEVAENTSAKFWIENR